MTLAYACFLIRHDIIPAAPKAAVSEDSETPS